MQELLCLVLAPEASDNSDEGPGFWNQTRDVDSAIYQLCDFEHVINFSVCFASLKWAQ